VNCEKKPLRFEEGEKIKSLSWLCVEIEWVSNQNADGFLSFKYTETVQWVVFCPQALHEQSRHL